MGVTVRTGLILGVKFPLGARPPSRATCATRSLGQGAPPHPPVYPTSVISQVGRNPPSAQEVPRQRQAPSNSRSIPWAWVVGERRHLLLPQTARVAVAGGVQPALPCGVVKPQRPHPNCCLDRPSLPHSPRSVIAQVSLKPCKRQ